MVVNIIVVAIIAVIAFFGIRRMVGTATGKRDCCSGASNGSGKRFKAVKITDTDESHYPYVEDFTISGMTCENCVKNVTNALDSISGTWATVDLDSRKAHVRSKNPIDGDAYRNAVSEAGYRIIAA